MTSTTNSLRVVAFRTGDMWVAQCLEYDIQAQGVDFDTVRRRLTATINCERQHSKRKNREAFEGLDPAPAEFEEMFEAVQSSLQDGEDVEMRIAA